MSEENINSFTAEKKKSFTVKTDIYDIFLFFSTFFTVFMTIHLFNEEKTDTVFGIIHFVFFIICAALTVIKEKKFRKAAVFPAILLILIFISYGFFTYLTALRLILSCYLFGWVMCALTGTDGFPLKNINDAFGQLRHLFLVPVKNVLLPLKSFIANRHETKLTKASGLITGIILGIPVFLFVAVLLSSADLAFNDIVSVYIDKIFEFIEELLDDFFTLILNIFFTAFLSPFVYAFIFSTKNKTEKMRPGENSRRIAAEGFRKVNSSVLTGFYFAISLCYVIFIFSQFTYLFSAFTGTAAYGYSLSSYARQGFFEMSAVAFINFCLIGAGAVSVKRKDTGEFPKVIKIFCAFFCLFTVLLIIIASAKMLLYITEMGLTEKRVAVILADTVLMTVFISIFIKFFRKSFPAIYIFSSTAITAVSLFLILSPAILIGSFNTHMYLSGHHKDIDIYTLSQIPSEYLAITKLQKLSDNMKDEEEDQRVKKQIYYLYNGHNEYSKKITVDNLLFNRYCERNRAELNSYSEFSTIFGTSDNKLITEKNFEEASISFEMLLPETAVKIKVENSVFLSEISYSDGSPFSYDKWLFEDEWAYLKDEGLFAKITLVMTDGEENVFYLITDESYETEIPERTVLVASDNIHLTFSAKNDGCIYLTAKQ